MADAAVVVDDLVGQWSALPIERVEALLVSWAARESVAKAQFLGALGEFVERRGWDAWGCVSPSQWLSWKCGLGKVAASEHVRAAVKLRSLPRIHAAMTEGSLSWSKVREVTRVATSETEHVWLDLALAGTAAHIERLVRAFRRVSPADVAHQHEDRRVWTTVDADGSVVICLKIPGEVGDGIMDAVRRRTSPERGVPYAAKLADTFIELLTGDSTVQPELVIHVDAPVLAGEPGSCASSTGTPVAPEVARQAACTGSVSFVVHDGAEVLAVSERRRFASSAQRRSLEARSRCCEVDGCDETTDLDVHHLTPSAHRGRTVLANLGRLCRRHHRLVHLHGLRVHRGASGRLVLSTSSGRPLDRPIERLELALDEPPGNPTPTWAGERLDLELAIWILANQSTVSSRKFEAEAA
jgi:Domain of unknown function (DUF222)